MQKDVVSLMANPLGSAIAAALTAEFWRMKGRLSK